MKYDITDRNDCIDEERASWLRDHLSRQQYRIVNNGFLIDNYELEFMDPAAETAYLLRWT